MYIGSLFSVQQLRRELSFGLNGSNVLRQLQCTHNDLASTCLLLLIISYWLYSYVL